MTDHGSWSLTLGRPLPDAGRQHTLDIGPEIRALKFTTGPGGFVGLAVDFRDRKRPFRSTLPEGLELRGRSHVTLYRGSYVCWEGLLSILHTQDGWPIGFTASGYALSGTRDFWYSNTSASTQTAGSLLKTILATCAPLLVVDQATFGDTGVLVSPSDVDGTFPANAIEKWSAQGVGLGDAAQPFDFTVWEGRRASWQARSVPAQPDWQMGTLKGVGTQEDYSDLYGAVQVRYTPPGGVLTTTAAVTSAQVATNYDYVRSTLLQANTLRAAEAAQLANTELALLSQPRLAVTINRVGGLERTGGVRGMGWEVRFGQWIQLGDRLVMVIETEYDATTDALTVQCESWPKSFFRKAFQENQRAAALLAAGLNPLSGGAL